MLVQYGKSFLAMKKINLKQFEQDDDGFVVTPIEDEELEQKMAFQTAPSVEPQEKVRVSFAKFAQLVSRSDLEQVLTSNPNAEVIIDTNLLAELATPSEEEEERKIPVIFSVGLVIGIVLTYILFKYL